MTMSFEFRHATVFDDLARVRMLGSAMRKTGRPVVLVPLRDGVHTGHISLIRAAALLPRAVVVVAWSGAEVPDVFADEGVDVVWRVDDEQLWPGGDPLVKIQPRAGFEPVEEISAGLTRLVALIGALGPSDVVVGEKDYELAVALRAAVRDLHLGVTVHGVPTVRTADGVAVSLRNKDVAEDAREKAIAFSAGLTAGATVAEKGAAAVLEQVRGVYRVAGIEPEYLEVVGADLGQAPEEGDGRLLAAARIGGVRLIDNVGLPLGIGFKNLTE